MQYSNTAIQYIEVPEKMKKFEKSKKIEKKNFFLPPPPEVLSGQPRLEYCVGDKALLPSLHVVSKECSLKVKELKKTK